MAPKPKSESLTDDSDRFSDLRSGDYEFSKTHVPLSLAKSSKDFLVSRSQARRILARFEDFQEVRLDFEGIDSIGQAFADEIFRVYQSQHPEIDIVADNCNLEVDRMIKRAIAGRAPVEETNPP